MPIPTTGISDEDSVHALRDGARARHFSSRTLLLDVALIAVGVALMTRQVVHAAGTPGIDFVHVWNATHHLLQGDGAYRDPLFTYPPGSAALLAPVGLLGYNVAKAVMLAVKRDRCGDGGVAHPDHGSVAADSSGGGTGDGGVGIARRGRVHLGQWQRQRCAASC